jgi:hypothetical protein
VRADAISGSPARPAESELSLDSVFTGSGDVAGGGAPPSSFKFDQFFSQRATNEHPAAGSREGAPAESPEDVAKFTQWLEGLKGR